MERAAEAVSPLHACGNAAPDTNALIALMQAEVLHQLQLCRQCKEHGNAAAAARAWRIAAAISEAGTLLRECAPLMGGSHAFIVM